MASEQERSDSNVDKNSDILQILIAEVQAFPTIWNKKSPAYKETHKKKIAWQKIALKLNIGVEDAKRKWKNVYDSYKKCSDRERQLEKSGAAYTKTPRCRYYNELHFLKDIVSTRTTVTNINLVSPETSVETNNSDDQSSVMLELNDEDNLSSSAVCSTPSTTPTAEKVPICPIKRRKKEVDHVDALLINALSNEMAVSSKADDPDTHFCLSLVEYFKSMPPKKNLILKSQIMALVSESLGD